MLLKLDPSIDHVMAYYFTLIFLTENDYTSLNNYHIMINKVNEHIASYVAGVIDRLPTDFFRTSVSKKQQGM